MLFVQRTVIENNGSNAFIFDICQDLIDKFAQTHLEIIVKCCIVTLCLIAWVIFWIFFIPKFPKYLHFFKGEDRRNCFESFGMLGIIGKNVFHFTKPGIQTHHDFFTDRVYRRIGDLRKFLFEKVRKVSLFFGKSCQWGIITHRCRGFFSLRDHGFDHLLDHLQRNIEKALHGIHGLFFRNIDRRERIAHMLLEVDHIFIHPLGIRLSVFEILVNVIAFEHCTVFEVDSHHFTRLKSASLDNILFRSLKRSILGGNQKPILFRNDIFGWSQTISVKYTSDISTICHTDRCRSVPRLEACTDIFVERSKFSIHMRCILPRCRKY